MRKMKAGIKITVTDEWQDLSEESIAINLCVSNGSCSSYLHDYVRKDKFKDFANQLRNFPIDINDRTKLEWGGTDLPWATFLVLEVYCYEPTGKSAIRVVMESHSVEPYGHRSEFFILCYPAAINILGQGLYNWNPLETRVFEWYPE